MAKFMDLGKFTVTQAKVSAPAPAGGPLSSLKTFEMNADILAQLKSLSAKFDVTSLPAGSKGAFDNLVNKGVSAQGTSSLIDMLLKTGMTPEQIAAGEVRFGGVHVLNQGTFEPFTGTFTFQGSDTVTVEMIGQSPTPIAPLGV
ncbi:MAG TPA: hypothetical protein VIT92_00480 [Burkholderiaceae bacterium]